MDWWWHPGVIALVGAFGTAYVHQSTGRDPRTGGLIGALAGLFLGVGFLVSLWVYLYYNRLNVHVINRQRHWYSWWKFW